MSKAKDISKTTGVNTGDETVTSIKTTLGITTLSGSNTGDETATTIKTALGITTLSGSNTGDQTLPTTLPASDVYPWAKEVTKPTYTYTEVGAQIAGTYATGTGSASGTNTGDQTSVSGNAGTVTTVTAANLAAAVIPSTSGNVLTSNGTNWTSVAPTPTGVTTFSGGTTGLLPSSATSGAVSLSGVLSVANGGTGQTTNGAAYTTLVGYTTVATATGTTVLDNTSENLYYFTGTLNQTITLPVVTTLLLGWSFDITNNSTGLLTINSSGGNLVLTIPSGMTAMVTCIDIATNTTATAWDYGYTDFTSLTGSGAIVLAKTPTLTALNLAAGTATASTAPLKIAAGIVLGTPEAGVIEVDTAATALYFTGNATNGRGFIRNQQIYRLTAAGTTIVNSAANFFGTTSNIPLVSGGYYEIDIYAIGLKGSTAGAVTWTFTNTIAPTLMIVDYEQSPLSGMAAVPGSVTALTNLNFRGVTSTTLAAYTFNTGSLAASVNHYFKFKILLNNSTGTSLKIQMTAAAGNASVTPQAGSVWIATRLPSNNVGAFAA